MTPASARARVLATVLALWLALSAAGALAAATSPDWSADFDRAVDQAHAALDKQDASSALDALEEAYAAAWRRLPFQAVEVSLAAAQPDQTGLFKPRTSNVYRPGEVLTIYLEIVGFEVRRDPASGFYLYDLSADFNLVDPSGKVLGGKRDIYHLEGPNRHFPTQLPLHFSYYISGLPVGKYQVETVLKDRLGHQTHTVVTPVQIQE